MTTETTPSTGVPAGITTHPAYALWAPVWRKLAHVYEGTGGFLDGTYLVPHPREWKDFNAVNPQIPTKKLLARRKLARYENVAATLLNQKKAALFRGAVTRTVGDSESTTPHPLTLWWNNVDGARTGIDDWMAHAFIGGAVFGHVAHVMDRPVGPQPFTKLDEQPVYLRLYSPLDIPDWLTDDRGQLTAVKLLEAKPRLSLDEPPTQSGDYRERRITIDSWELRESGARVDGNAHGFGRLPLVLHYTQRRDLSPLVGASVLSDPNLYIDIYNLTSEIRELLRLQTFGLLNVELGTGDNKTSVEDATRMMGDETGTDNVFLTPGPAQYLQPDTANITVYQAERKELLRTIYRLAAIPWESDSLDAEAEGSIRLKREDMNQILASYADECEKAEYEIAELWFRAQYGADNWEQRMADAQVVIRYPDTFDVTPFAEILEQAQAALTFEMGPTFLAELKTRLVAKFLPDAGPDVIATIEKEIEKLAKESADPNALVKKAKAVMQQLAQQGAEAA